MLHVRLLNLTRPGLLALALCLPFAAVPASAQEPPAPAEGEEDTEKKDPKADRPSIGLRQGPDVGREQMWKAPTEADWAKPCLITFQRTWDDALAVSKETGKAILICINMDGEIASEHYAGVRYREPAVTALYEPYVCVIASVYRHTPRDYDDEGRRVPCPRFGSVTCGEHIAIEPPLYAKYMDGQRVAPRHIMVELDGEETYDIFYANDTASVFDAVRDGIMDRKDQPPPVVRGDKPVVERVASRDIVDRKKVEQAYRDGDAEARKALLEAAMKNMDKAPIELLRLAVFGFDTERSKQAREALAQTESKAAIDVIADALAVPMSAEERDALIAALERIGATSRRAAWLAVVHKGLTRGSASVDAGAWSKGLADAVARAPSSYEGHALRRERDAQAARAKKDPKNVAARIELAVATLELARKSSQMEADPKEARAFRKLLYHDARTAALDAEKLGTDDWRVQAVLTIADYDTGNADAAYERAETAVKLLPPGDPSWNAMAVITIFGEARFKAIKAAIKAKEKWQPEWLTDLHAAYTILLQHPNANAGQVVWHYDFLDYLRAYRRAWRYLGAGIQRFPESKELHERFRRRVMRWRGPDGIEKAYGEMLTQHGESAGLRWYAARASVSGAEFHRRGRRGEKALAAYASALEHFDKVLAADPSRRTAIDHQVALVLAGRSRVHYQAGDDAAALADILASFERNKSSAGTRDGVGINPGETAQMLLARLKETDALVAVAQLEAALAGIDPELLRPDRP